MNAIGTAPSQANGIAVQQTTQQVPGVTGTTEAPAGLFQLLLSGQLGQTDGKQTALQELLDTLASLDSAELLELLTGLGIMQPKAIPADVLAGEASPQAVSTEAGVERGSNRSIVMMQPTERQISAVPFSVQAAEQIVSFLKQAGISPEFALQQIRQAVQQAGVSVQSAVADLLRSVAHSNPAKESVSFAQLASEMNMQRVETKKMPDRAATAVLPPVARIQPVLLPHEQVQPAKAAEKLTASPQMAETTAQSADTRVLSFGQSAQVQPDEPSSGTNGYAGVVTRSVMADPALPLPSQSAHVQMRADQFRFEFPAAVVKQANLLESGGANELRITLMPEGLGEVQVRIQGENGQVSLMISADTAHARSLLDGSINLLRQQLEAQGVQVNRVEVTPSSAAGSMAMNQGMLTGQNRQRQDSHPRHAHHRQQENESSRIVESGFYQAVMGTSIGQIDITA